MNLPSNIRRLIDARSSFLLVILLLQCILCASIFFDIAGLRQVIGFFYLTFVPGIVIVKLLRLDKLGLLLTAVLSVGFSIAFVELIGLLVNEVSSTFGFYGPISSVPLLIAMNGVVLGCAILIFLRTKNTGFREVKNLISPSLVLLIGLPLLSAVGAIWVDAFKNNIILLFLLLGLSLIFVVSSLFQKLIPSKLYPLIVFVMAISLLYHASLISQYLVGHDVQLEYFISMNVKNNAYWSETTAWGTSETALNHGRFNSMLSVAILPTVYSILMSIDLSWIFKVVFPFIFSFVPFGLYMVWKENIGEKYAFIAAFFFMAYETFYTEMLGLPRQMIAEFFFVLILIVILNERIEPSSKIICFVVFSFGLVTSHYGLSEIVLFFVSLTFISLFLVRRPSRKITAGMVMVFFVIMFFWYIYTSGSAVFDSILEFGNYVNSRLGEFLNTGSRESTVLRGLGLTTSPTVWNQISRVFAYATEFLIAAGFAGLLTKRVKLRGEKDWFVLSALAMALLAALILVPGLSDTMNMTRFYHILLFFLSPLCVMGAQFLARLVSKRREELVVSILLVIILVPYFLFQTSFIYEVTRSESWSVPLSEYRMKLPRLYAQLGYIESYSALGAQWISKNVNVDQTQIYADTVSVELVLTSYGMIYRGDVNSISNTTKIEVGGILYMSRLNVVGGKIVGKNFVWNSSDFFSLFNDSNKVYSNSESEIYEKTPLNG